MEGGDAGIGANLGEEGVAPWRGWRRRQRSSASGLGAVAFVLILLSLVPRAAGAVASGRTTPGAFLRLTTPAAMQQQTQRSCRWMSVPPKRTKKVETALWSVAQEEEGQQRQRAPWERRRAQPVLLEAPQRYGSQDWMENLMSLLGSRITKRISGHLIFNTGTWSRLPHGVRTPPWQPTSPLQSMTAYHSTQNIPNSVGGGRDVHLRVSPGPGGRAHVAHPAPAHVHRAGPPPRLPDERGAWVHNTHRLNQCRPSTGSWSLARVSHTHTHTLCPPGLRPLLGGAQGVGLRHQRLPQLGALRSVRHSIAPFTAPQLGVTHPPDPTY